MQLVAVEGLRTPHRVPLAVVHVDRNVVVELDDEHEQRFRLVFSPYQALRVTTADCFSLPAGAGPCPLAVVEVLDSPWVEQLRAVLARVDQGAKFMEQARHFLIPGGDDYIEVVAWSVDCEPVAAPAG